MRYLGLLDLAGIQETIERESKLKAIRKVSRRIEDLTRRAKENRPDGLFRKVVSECSATLLMAAGGNASFWADSKETVQRVLRGVSLELEKQATGLQVVGAIYPFEKDTLSTQYRKALRELERRKFTQGRSTRFRFAGLEKFEPVVPPEETPQDPTELGFTSLFIAPEEFDNVVGRGFRLHPLPGTGTYSDPMDSATPSREEIERTGLMAVVSMDGLGMGDRLNRWLRKMEEENPPDDVFRVKFQAWSDSVRKRWDDAWQQSWKDLEAAFGADRMLRHTFRPELWLEPLAPREKGSMPRDHVHEPGEPLYAPFAHIYQGGDDLRFVCDARLALSFATSMMRYLEEAAIGKDVDRIFEGLTASAGLVFVDSHFPFSRASVLADDIRQNAKKHALRLQPDAWPPPSCLDWWVNRQGSLDEEQRTTRDGARPLRSRGVPEEVTWDCLARYVLPNLWEMFAGRRNKLKDILSAVEEGPRAVRRLLSLRPMDEYPDLSPCTPPGYEPLTGFNREGNRTFLRDAAELYDLHFPYGDLAGKADAWPEIAVCEEGSTCSSH